MVRMRKHIFFFAPCDLDESPSAGGCSYSLSFLRCASLRVAAAVEVGKNSWGVRAHS